MSQESVEDFIRRGYARFNQAEREPVDEQELASLDIWHRDGVYVNSASDPDPAVHRGIEAVRRQIRQWVEAYPDLQVEPLEIRTNGDRAFVWVRFSGHGAESGIPLTMEMAHVNILEGGKLHSIEEYQERTEGLKAAGLSE
ncbi:MAG: nuclear transport factor 2 family protein [Vicinamibacteria bacterium]|jgi:ketosteroid isomerase-like protein